MKKVYIIEILILSLFASVSFPLQVFAIPPVPPAPPVPSVESAEPGEILPMEIWNQILGNLVDFRDRQAAARVCSAFRGLIINDAQQAKLILENRERMLKLPLSTRRVLFWRALKQGKPKTVKAWLEILPTQVANRLAFFGDKYHSGNVDYYDPFELAASVAGPKQLSGVPHEQVPALKKTVDEKAADEKIADELVQILIDRNLEAQKNGDLAGRNVNVKLAALQGIAKSGNLDLLKKWIWIFFGGDPEVLKTDEGKKKMDEIQNIADLLNWLAPYYSDLPPEPHPKKAKTKVEVPEKQKAIMDQLKTWKIPFLGRTYEYSSFFMPKAEPMEVKGPSIQMDVIFNNVLKLGNLEQIRVLIQNGADVNGRVNGKSLLERAINKSSAEVVNILIENGADVKDGNLLVPALVRAHINPQFSKIVKTLIEKGVNVNTAKTANSNFTSTPLHLAIETWDLDLVLFMIEKGADIKRQNPNGQTPLNQLCSKIRRLKEERNPPVPDEEILKVAKLLIHPETVNLPDDAKETPLHLAALPGSTELVQLLLAKGADVRAKDSMGRTPLHFAVRSGSAEKVLLLLKKGADVRAKDEEGSTPLHQAIYSSSISNSPVPRLLIRGGADVNATMQSNPNNLFMSWMIGGRAISPQGLTPLHLAINSGRLDLVMELLIRGARLTNLPHGMIPQEIGMTPREIAISSNHPEIAQFLDGVSQAQQELRQQGSRH